MLLPKDYTEQENKIAEILSDLGLRYDQQVGFGKYTVDFHIKELGMVIEADGIYGHLRKRDVLRDTNLQSFPGIEYIIHIKENTKRGIKDVLWQVLNKLTDSKMIDPNQKESPKIS